MVLIYNPFHVLVSVSRRYRLRGNLLFYFRGVEQWSEPIGVIVLENFSIQIHECDQNGQWPFQISKL